MRTCNKMCNGVESWGGGSTAVQLINHNGLTGTHSADSLCYSCLLGSLRGLCTAFCDGLEIDGPGKWQHVECNLLQAVMPYKCGSREVHGCTASCFHATPEKCLSLAQLVLSEGAGGRLCP